jgi:hypothetical protein
LKFKKNNLLGCSIPDSRCPYSALRTVSRIPGAQVLLLKPKGGEESKKEKVKSQNNRAKIIKAINKVIK